MKLHVNQFLGIAPKIGETLLNNNQAQTALNAQLWSNTLRPIAGKTFNDSLDKSTGEIKTIWRYDGDTDWLCWTQDVDVVRTPIAGDTLEKIYFTGTDAPRVTTKDLWDDGTPGTSIPPASYLLGIPAPVGPPVASDAGAGNITSTSAWVYTFVRKWSDGTVDEGPPSTPSNVLTSVTRKVDVTIPTGAPVVANYGITHKRLYRTNGTLYFFVQEELVSATTTQDNTATANLGSEITTTTYLPPPDALIGLTELATGVLAGFKGNVVYLSEPYRPWAFPTRNQYTCSWPVVAIAGFGSTVVVGTEGYPYIGRGIDPAAYAFRPQRGANYPCISKRSMATGQIGVFWATHEGLALANESGVTLVTREFLTRKEWTRDFAPSTMHGQVYGDRYYGWYTTGLDDGGHKVGGGIVLDRSESAFLTTHIPYFDAARVIKEDGKLYVVTRGTNDLNQVFAFDDDPSNPLTYEWKSKLFVSPGLDNLGFAQIIGDFGQGLSPAEIAALEDQIAAVEAYNDAQTTNGLGNGQLLNDQLLNGADIFVDAPSSDFTTSAVLFRYWAEGDLKITRTVLSSAPFPMPSGFTAEKHEFAVSGEVEITSVTLASTMEELAEV